MAVKKEPCKNHPDRLTSRRCYYCKAPICPECQLHLAHHLFCSKKCYYLWQWQQFVKRIKKLRHKEFYFSLALILIAFVSLFFYVNYRFNQLPTREIKPAPARQQDSLWFDLDTTIVRATGHITFDIKGSPKAAVSLWQNGRLIAMKPNGEKMNSFRNIPLVFGKNRFVLWEHSAGGTQVLVDSFQVQWNSARLRFMALPLYRVPMRSKWLALTFDAGSTDRGSLEILNILREKHIRCTLFVTGQFVRHFPDVVRQMVIDGHEVGDHTFSHPHLTSYAQNGKQETLPDVNRAFVFKQLLKTDSLFKAVTGKHLMPFWRAPFGEFNRQILRWAAEAGFKHVGWSKHCDALDWVADTTSNMYRSSKQILQHFLHFEETSGLQGRIILMHLGTDRIKDFPYQILPAFIDSLRQRGYRFVTVGELISQKAKEYRVAGSGISDE